MPRPLIFFGQISDLRCPACGYQTQKQYGTAIVYRLTLLAPALHFLLRK